MPDAPLALRSKVESALVAYLTARVAAAGTTALSGVGIRQRQESTTTDKKFPLVVCECVRAPAFESMNELYMCDVLVALASLANEPPAATAAERHAQRTGLLTEWLADRTAFLAYVNEGLQPWIDPAPAPITPPVPDLLVHDILLEDEQGEQTGEHWLEALAYLVPAQLRSSV